MIQDIPVFRDNPPGGKVFLVGGLDRLTAAYYGEGAALGSYYSIYDGRAAYDDMGNPDG